MGELKIGETTEMQGSGSKPYIIKNVDDINWTCSCPAWRNQSIKGPRTCKHIKKLRGEAAEAARLSSGGTSSPVPVQANIQVAATAPNSSPVQEKWIPALLLANSFEDEEVDPTGWYQSEKLDGCRAYWSGKDFFSREGNIFESPAEFKVGLPPHPLDGELWMGRGMFQKTISAIRSKDWSKFLVFDHPSHGGKFKERLSEVFKICLEAKSQWFEAHPHSTVGSLEELQDELKRIEALGGEGLMLRKPDSFYVSGKSSTLLKVKPFKDDEGIVTGFVPGKGKHKGVVGSLILKWKGVTFNVGSGLKASDRRNPPALGAKVTFRYSGLTDGGLPKCTSFIAERNYE